MKLHLPTSPRGTIALVATTIVLAAGGAVAVDRGLIPSGATRTAAVNYGVLQAEAKAHPKHAQVPYVGPFNFKGCGPAITELDKALIRKHFRKAKPAPCYGKPTQREVAAFQRSIHYKPTGRYTIATHLALVARGGYTSIARFELTHYALARYVDAYRNAVQRIGQHTLLVGGSTLVYTQHAERQTFPPWPFLPAYSDCSSLVIWIEYQAGAGPAVGYFGPGSIVGYTGTLAREGRPIAFNAKLEPGDVIILGGGHGYHAMIYMGGGLALSHGGTGVKYLPWDYSHDVGSIRRMVG